MTSSENCAALVREFEGFAANAYWDNGGWAIGYGHHGPEVMATSTMTKEQAEETLRQDLLVRSEALTERLGAVVVNQNQFDALIDFYYNLGNLKALPFRLLDKGRPATEVAQSLLLYRKSQGRILPGLEKRRAAEKELFLRPVG